MERPFTLRILRPEDAEGVSTLAQKVYGRGYVRAEIYSPEEIRRRNEAGDWTSIVAVDAADQVVAHSAIEPSRFGPIAEMGMSMVLREHRRNGLLERLRDAVIDEASRVGLAGYFVEIATDNAAVQGLTNRSTVFPCAITLGLWPKGKDGERTQERQSFIRSFRYLRRPERVAAHVPAHHAEILTRLYGEMHVPLDLNPSSQGAVEGAASGGVVVERFDWCQSTFVTVTDIGPGTAARIEAAHQAFRDDPAMESAYLELPLAQPGAALACVHAERLGFFFCGVTPFGARDGDVLRLQLRKRREPVSEPGILHPFARELCDYIARAAGA